MRINRLLPLLIFILLALFLCRGLFLKPQELPAALLNKKLPIFALDSLNKKKKFTPAVFEDQVVLLNVWASWCESCIAEQELLLQLANQGIPIYGLNYKDSSSRAQRWLDEWGDPYRDIGQDYDGQVAIDLGVYGTPETFLIDKQGIIRYKHIGILDEKTWRDKFLEKFRQLQQAN